MDTLEVLLKIEIIHLIYLENYYKKYTNKIKHKLGVNEKLYVLFLITIFINQSLIHIPKNNGDKLFILSQSFLYCFCSFYIIFIRVNTFETFH